MTSITHLGSAYSEQFRAVIGSSPALKSAIEQAAILNQTNKAAEQKRIEEANKRKEQANKPAIQLKMNFGNFNWWNLKFHEQISNLVLFCYLYNIINKFETLLKYILQF